LHNESIYFAGAEKMLGYYLGGLLRESPNVTLAATSPELLRRVLPAETQVLAIPAIQPFSFAAFFNQIRTLLRSHRREPFSLIHGWTARTWELTSLMGALVRRPTLGTLHDHPQAPFISRKRQRLMCQTANRGLTHVACVSEAVRQACLQVGYSGRKLSVIHNGLPGCAETRSAARAPEFTIGYLGAFSRRKGFEGFFEILNLVSQKSQLPWQAQVAGEALDQDGRELVEGVRRQFTAAPWWPRIRWMGWTDDVHHFLQQIDLLICPSAQFDPFPTVLLEAGRAGVPVLAAQVGGVAEIVLPSETGWLFKPEDWPHAAEIVARCLANLAQPQAAGKKAQARIISEFALDKMIAQYRELYSTLSANV
jgi:glycosyltransferase involved in cell wall biosynthesis